MSKLRRRHRRRLLPVALLTAALAAASCSSVMSGTAAPAPSDGSSQATPSLPPGGSGSSQGSSSGTGPSETPGNDPGPSSSPGEPSSPGQPSSPGRPTSPAEPTSPADPTETGGSQDGIGDPGIGDDYYPTAGNGGYQVDHYDLQITYLPEDNALTGSATLTGAVTADEELSRFNLDLQPSMTVESVEVDGAAAEFTQSDAELVITPAEPLQPATELAVKVGYAGAPEPVSGGTSGLGDGGWYRTRSGGALVAGEPFSASAWYPVNEHPADPAAYSVTVTVPEKWDVMAGGVEFDGALPPAPDGMINSRWDIEQPIASYLVTLYIDTFTVRKDETADGLPVVSAFAPDNTADEAFHEQTGQIVEVLSGYFGEYPFDAVGGIYSDEQIPFALETATRPVYADWVDLDTVVHELAHQWYGDDVSVNRWRDICLNECFASYAPWLWHADVDQADLDRDWKEQMEYYADIPAFWQSPLVDMGAGNEFSSVYDRGPLAVHALRHAMGEDAFRTLLKQWPATYGGKNAAFEDLEAMASELSGKDLTTLFDVWFRGTEPPTEQDYPDGLR